MSAFIDTNVLIYAQGTGPKSETAREAILAGGKISVQVLNEFAAVLRRKFRLEWDQIADAVADVRAALGPVRPVDIETHLHALDLARAHGFNFYDALIVAAALGAGCDRLLTEDLQGGRRINGLTIEPLAKPCDGVVFLARQGRILVSEPAKGSTSGGGPSAA